MEKFVVSLRWGAGMETQAALERARDVVADFSFAGGTLVGFGAFEVSFAFAPADAVRAIELTVSVVKQSGCFPRAGIAEGNLDTLHPSLVFKASSAADGATPNVEVAWGEALILASAQARMSQLGEVLVDASVGLLRDEALRARTGGREITVAGTPRKSISLDLDMPFINAPASERISSAGREPSSALIEAARDVLAKPPSEDGEGETIDELVAQLSATGEPIDVVQRLAAVLALSRGATEEGLRLLRSAAQVEQPGEKRARSVLAYAIGVALVGRPEDALLEGLAALALARETNDEGGERACARFLSQLSASSGHPEAARAWAHVARGSVPPPGSAPASPE